MKASLSPDSVADAIANFRSSALVFTTKSSSICATTAEYDRYEAEAQLFANGCELMQLLSTSSNSAIGRVLDLISTDLSTPASSVASVFSELRKHANLSGASKLLSGAPSSLSAATLQSIISSLFTVSLKNPTAEAGDVAEARHRLKKLASGDSLLFKWTSSANALKAASKAFLGKAEGLQIFADAAAMMSTALEALAVATEHSVTHVCQCVRFLNRILYGQSSSVTPKELEMILRSVWDALKQWKDFSSRRVSQFTAIAFAPYFLRSDDSRVVAILKGYLALLTPLAEAAMGIMNSFAMRFTKAFSADSYPLLEKHWLEEFASLLLFGLDRKGQSEAGGDIRVETGYSGPQFDFYVRSLANKLALDISLQATVSVPGASPALAVVDRLFQRLLWISLYDPEVRGSDLAKNMAPHRKVTRCWQTLCLLSVSVSQSVYLSLSDIIWDSYRDMGAHSIRDLMACALAIYFRRFPLDANSRLLSLLSWEGLLISYDITRTAKEDAVFSSLALAGGLLAHPTLLPGDSPFFQALVRIVIPFLTINTLYLRGVAHEIIRLIFGTSQAEESFRKRVGEPVHQLLKNFDSIIQVQIAQTMDVKKKRREALALHLHRLLDFDGALDTRARLIDAAQVAFCDQPTTSQTEQSEIVDLAFMMESYQSIKSKNRRGGSDTTSEEDLVAAIIAERGNQEVIDSYMAELDLIVTAEAEQQNFQKKILPWQQMNVNSATETSDEQREANEGTHRPRQEIIIVATMLKKAANLGGLTRTAEIFQASQLVIPSKLVLQDRVYQQLCVTAHHWVPTIEVPESALREYLLSKKAEGYSLIGAEQTADSVQLTTVSWPRKTVLVLGDERQGIPAQYINLLDQCVEIPQLGVVRSLNVHVTGSIMLWEYSRQHAFAEVKAD